VKIWFVECFGQKIAGRHLVDTHIVQVAYSARCHPAAAGEHDAHGRQWCLRINGFYLGVVVAVAHAGQLEQAGALAVRPQRIVRTNQAGVKPESDQAVAAIVGEFFEINEPDIFFQDTLAGGGGFAPVF
jgi:hypothetical protein